MDTGIAPATAAKLPSVEAGAHMSDDNHLYHRAREQHCRAMAELASDPEVRRRHEELASLHADRAALYSSAGRFGTELGAG